MSDITNNELPTLGNLIPSRKPAASQPIFAMPKADIHDGITDIHDGDSGIHDGITMALATNRAGARRTKKEASREAPIIAAITLRPPHAQAMSMGRPFFVDICAAYAV